MKNGNNGKWKNENGKWKIKIFSFQPKRYNIIYFIL